MSSIDASITKPLFELYRAGAFKELAEEARALLALHPGELVPHTLLGAACLETGDYEAAVDSYRAALAIRPGFAKAHNSLGLAYLRLERPGPAAEAFQQAIDNDPGFAEPRFNLGIVLENQQRPEDAAEQYRQAVALNPGYAKAWCALARVRWEAGEHEQVAEQFRQALAADYAHLPAHRGLLQFLEQSNRHREWRAANAQARAALGGEHPLVRYHQGLAAAAEGDHKQAIELLDDCEFDAAEPSGLHDERMRQSHLANIYDRLGDTECAMRHASAANRLSSRCCAAKGIDKVRFLEFVDNRLRVFHPDNLLDSRFEGQPARAGRSSEIDPPANQSRGHHTHPAPIESPSSQGPGSTRSAARDDVQPVFIVGFPRSGTTLLDAMLRGHPQIQVAEESDAVPALVNQLSGAQDSELDSLHNQPASAIDSARAVYFQRLARHLESPPANATIIDRFALNIIYAGEICKVFPDARFILMLRHPADCVLSCFLRTFRETSANASFHSLADAAFLYDRVFSLWQRYTEALPLNVLEVRYENLVESVEGTCRPVLDFIGLPWHPGILDHAQTARNRPYIRTASYNQVVEPIHSKAKGRWLRYRRHLEPVLPTIKPWMEAFGYDTDA